ncbi:MAG: thioesterase family protein [Pseudomonadota bacterium]
MGISDEKAAEMLHSLRIFFEENIPFNKVIGLQVASLDLENICVRIDMKETLIGNPVKRILHGGVISSVLDVTGGIVAMAGVIKQMEGRTTDEISRRLLKIGTIDLRIDYLRPGEGEYFLATGTVMRTGNKVSVVRMQFHNDKDCLIAAGTGTYIIG